MAQPAGGGKQDTKQPQGGEGRPGMRMMEPLPADKAKAAWELEATTVAKRLNLSADQTKSLVSAYDSARTSQQTAMEKFRKDQQEKMKGKDQEDRRAAGQDMRKAMEDFNKTQRENLTKAITGAVPGDAGTKAAAALSAYNPQTDRMFDTISGFKLDASKQTDALNAVDAFAADQAKNFAGEADPEARRDSMQAARTKLTDSLKKDLSDDQMKKFEELLPGARANGAGRGEKPKKDK
jgi:hypothetical protein